MNSLSVDRQPGSCRVVVEVMGEEVMGPLVASPSDIGTALGH